MGVVRGTVTIYLYDAEGNLATRHNILDDSYRVFVWDHRNRLIEVLDYDSENTLLESVAYVYDPFNRRIAKHFDGDDLSDWDEFYIYDGTDIVLDFVDADGDGGGASPELAKRYLWGPAEDQLLAQENYDAGQDETTRLLWGLADHLGSPRDYVEFIPGDELLETEDETVLIVHFALDSFGNILSGDATEVRYIYTAQEYDAETGFYYYDRRYVDPSTGRFISEDFIWDGYNKHAYVGNAPTMFVDPNGLMPNASSAITLPVLIGWAEELEKRYPDESPHEILVRLRDQIKNQGRSSKSGGSGTSHSDSKSDSGSGSDDSGDSCSPANGTPNPVGGPYWSYIYTTERGWIDLGHFLEAARYGAWLDDWLVRLFGTGVEVHQYVKGRIKGRQTEGMYSSAFTEEDLTSNYEGTYFGDGLNDNEKLSSQLNRCFTEMGATDPTKAPNYMAMPRTEEDWEQRVWREYDANQNSPGRLGILWDELLKAYRLK